MELGSCTHVLFFKAKEGCPQGDSEIIGLPPQVQGWELCCFWFSRLNSSHLELGMWDPSQLWDCDPPHTCHRSRVGTTHWVWKAKGQTKEDYSQASGLILFTLWDFGISWDLIPSSSFQFLPLEKSTRYMSHHYILEALNLSDVIGSKLERNFASGWVISPVSLIPDLDEILNV